jgi:Family of unknown function (DUF6263)
MKSIFVLVALSANFAFGQQYSLALNLEAGKTYSFTINSTNHFTGEMDGQKMNMTSVMTGFMKFKVVKSSAIDYELEASYDTLHLAVKSSMGNMEFSTGNSSGPSNMMSSRHFNITVLKNGAVSKIDNPDTTGFMSMMKNFPMAQGLKQMMMGPLKKSFSKESMKENMEKLTAIFPNKKVSLNESWGSVVQPDSVTDNTVKTSYQLISYGSGIATIKGHSESKASSNNKQKSGFGFMFPLVYDVQGDSESNIQVSTVTGWVKEASIKNELKGNVKMNDPNNKQAKSGPIQMDGNVVISSY